MFVHLHLHTPYSFLDGASEIEPLVRRAAHLGMNALAMTDHDNVCAAVKFTMLCRQYRVHPILGAEFTMQDDTHLTLVAPTRESYAALCHLLTVSHTCGGRRNPHLPWDALFTPSFCRSEGDAIGAAGAICLSGCRNSRIARCVRDHRYDEARSMAERLRDTFGEERFFIELQDDFTPDSYRVCRELALLADAVGVGVVATNNVHYVAAEDSITHDILRCIAHGVPMAGMHAGRPLNGERYLKDGAEMAELFGWRPDAIANTVKIAEMCDDVLPSGEEITPSFPVPGGVDAAVLTATEWLFNLVALRHSTRPHKFGRLNARAYLTTAGIITPVCFGAGFLFNRSLAPSHGEPQTGHVARVSAHRYAQTRNCKT